MDLSKIGGIVSIPLGLISIISLTLILERLTFWLFLLSDQKKVRSLLLSNYKSLNDEKPEITARQSNHPLVILYHSVNQHNVKDLESLQRKIKTGFETISPILRRYDTALATIVAVSPLLGLLGTVLGLIRSFEGLGLGQPLENTEIVISGISEALVSTAIGLIIAIVTLAFTNLFRSFRRSENHELLLFANTLEEQFLNQR